MVLKRTGVGWFDSVFVYSSFPVALSASSFSAPLSAALSGSSPSLLGLCLIQERSISSYHSLWGGLSTRFGSGGVMLDPDEEEDVGGLETVAVFEERVTGVPSGRLRMSGSVSGSSV